MPKIEEEKIEFTHTCSPSSYLNLCDEFKTLKDAEPLVINRKICGVQFLIDANGEPLTLYHYKKEHSFVTQWALDKGGKSQKIGRKILSSNDLSIEDAKRDNKLKNALSSKGISVEPYSLDSVLSEAGELLSNNFDLFFGVTEEFKLEGESKKDSHLRKIADEIEGKCRVIIDKITGELYIYSEEKGIYESYNVRQFTKLLQDEYDFRFSQEDAKKIISTFVNDMEENHDYIAFENCLLNLETLEPEEHTPDVFCKFQVPYKYNPTAKSPYFEKKIKEILCDDVDGDKKFKFFLQWIGYCLTPDNRLKKLSLILGDTNTGKSVLMALVRGIFGEKISSVALQNFDKSFGLQPLIGAKVNILYDLPLQKIMDIGIIKAITGEDSITIDRKYKEPITTKLGTKIIGVGNALPEVNDDSRAFYQRLFIIELVKNFDKPIPNLADKLVQDKEGMEWFIYNAVQEFKKVESEGWAIQPSIKETRADYLKHSNPCLWAAKQLFEEDSDPDGYLTRDLVYFKMKEFLEENNLNAPKLRSPYYAAIRKIGGDTDRYKVIDDVNTRIIKGVKFK